MTSVRARAYASIANLGYGFDTFAVCVNAGWDEVELRLAKRDSIEVTGGGSRGIPKAIDGNTAGRALRGLLRQHGIEQRVRIRIRKGVPAGGGLGSSAASAAAAVFAANRLFGLGLTRTELVAYAAHGEIAAAGVAHADNVAAALLGGFVIVDPSDPARVHRLLPPGRLRFAIAMPRLRMTTEEARRVLPRRVTLADYSLGCARAGRTVAALCAGDVAAFGASLEGAFTDRARGKLIPGFAEVQISARAAGAAGVALSGAGPAIMAVVDGMRVSPARVAAAMRDAFARAGVTADAIVARVASGARVSEARA